MKPASSRLEAGFKRPPADISGTPFAVILWTISGAFLWTISGTLFAVILWIISGPFSGHLLPSFCGSFLEHFRHTFCRHFVAHFCASFATHCRASFAIVSGLRLLLLLLVVCGAFCISRAAFPSMLTALTGRRRLPLRNTAPIVARSGVELFHPGAE